MGSSDSELKICTRYESEGLDTSAPVVQSIESNLLQLIDEDLSFNEPVPAKVSH